MNAELVWCSTIPYTHVGCAHRLDPSLSGIGNYHRGFHAGHQNWASNLAQANEDLWPSPVFSMPRPWLPGLPGLVSQAGPIFPDFLAKA